MKMSVKKEIPEGFDHYIVGRSLGTRLNLTDFQW